MFGIVQQVAMYLSASAKRLETFRDVDNASEVDDMPDRHTLRKLSDTRWGSRCDALSNTAFKQLYQTVKSFAAFVDIQHSSSYIRQSSHLQLLLIYRKICLIQLEDRVIGLQCQALVQKSTGGDPCTSLF